MIEVPWGKVQLWREYSEAAGRPAGRAEHVFLRFLGSRGRAELATLDPADRIGETPAEVWTVNAPAFGGTSGPPDLEHYADCALAAADFLSKRAEGRPLWVCGKSIGTTAAMLVAADREIAGAILRNAMPLRELLEGHYAWRTGGLSRFLVAPAIPERLDSLANASRARSPALFLVSKQDRVVPPVFQHQLIARYGGRAVVLEVKGEHDERALGPGDEETYRRLLRELLQEPTTRSAK